MVSGYKKQTACFENLRGCFTGYDPVENLFEILFLIFGSILHNYSQNI